MRPIIIPILASLVAGILSFLIFFFRPQVTVSVSPSTAKIRLGEAEAVGQGRFTVWPGTYEITIENPGFVPLQKSESLSVGKRLALSVELKPIPQSLALSLEPVLLVGLSTDKKAVLYVGNKGKTLYSRTDKEQTVLTPDSFNNPILFRLSPEQDVAILKNPNGDVFIHDFKRYNLVEQKQFLFGRDIGALDWIYPTGERLLYSYAPTSGERSLILADRTNKNIERVLNLKEVGIFNPTISVSPDGKTALLVSRPGSDYKSYTIFLFDLLTKRARQLTTDGNKVNARFDPSGKYILFTRYDQDPEGLVNQLLSVMEADGKNRKDFNIRTTLDQVGFLDEGALVIASSSKEGDQLLKFNLVSGESATYYYQAKEPIHFNKVVLAGDGKSIYATGSQKIQEPYGTLYAIKLEMDEYE
jgi:hypothetical protein